MNRLIIISKINNLKAELTATDYLSHKFADKALTDEEYEPMRIQRQQWRDEINELEKLIDNPTQV